MSKLIVVGCPVKERAWCLQRWFDSIAEQDVELEIICLYSPSEDRTEEILLQNNAHVVHDYRPGRSPTEIHGHQWGHMEDYQYMAEIRNTLLEIVIDKYDPDYYFSLDSDILLPPNALTWMVDKMENSAHGVMAPALNMAVNSKAMNTMCWVDRYNPHMAHRPFTPNTGGYVDVVMAAMLLNRRGMEAQWVAHAQGEDIGFCLDAKSKSIPLWWEPSIQCEHLMVRYV